MKSVTKIVLIIAVAIAIVGVCQINDNLDKRIYACEPLFSADLESGERCVRNALDTHNEEVNRGWALAIVGGIVGFGAFGVLCIANEYGPKK